MKDPQTESLERQSYVVYSKNAKYHIKPRGKVTWVMSGIEYSSLKDCFAAIRGVPHLEGELRMCPFGITQELRCEPLD